VAIELIYLDREALVSAGLLDFARAVEDVESVFKMLAAGEVVMPPKVAIELFFNDGSPKGHLIAMPVYVKPLGVAGVKWAAGFFRNPERGLPHGLDVIVLSDPETGRPLAVMEGALVTAVRTGAAAAVGAKYLAPDGTEIAALIGAGVVGRAAAHALRAALPGLAELRVYDLKREKAEAVAKEVGGKVAGGLERAVRGSDIVVTATTSHSQFVKLGWLKRDCLCVEIGKNELEDAVILRADRVVVDYWEQVKSREWVSLARLWRQGLLPESRIEEIARIVSMGRLGGGGLRVFSPIGMACEDIVVANRLYREAEKRGLGVRLPLWRATDWL
jgi:ornithine cyclodeaminase/alanine dehydrogenase-like protein (mu-crystallin family)